MSLAASQITIAITVFNRRQFLKQAISTALNQTVPVRVIVVEDDGPDPTLEAFVKDEFGSRIEYIRNPKRRGLFDNWNACIEYCKTEWLSILHDDDYVDVHFIEDIIWLSQQAPGCGLYFGRTVWVDNDDKLVGGHDLTPKSGRWHKVGLEDILVMTPFDFPGHLFNVRAAKAAGGFCPKSYYCGDWEMWAKLIARNGSAQTAAITGYKRAHESLDKGTNAVIRNGWQIPATMVQHKRVLALLPKGSPIKFDRRAYFREKPVSTRFLIRYGIFLRRRFLEYHVQLLRISRPPNWQYALYKACASLGGVYFVLLTSKLWNWCHRN